MTDRELMQMANRIEALAFEMKAPNSYTPQFVMLANEIRARARLAQPEPEPVAWTPKIERLYDKNGFLLHQKIKRTPSSEWEDYYPEPQREWQGLTDEEIQQTLWKELGIGQDDDEIAEFARAIEAKLKEKNA